MHHVSPCPYTAFFLRLNAVLGPKLVYFNMDRLWSGPWSLPWPGSLVHCGQDRGVCPGLSPLSTVVRTVEFALAWLPCPLWSGAWSLPWPGSLVHCGQDRGVCPGLAPLSTVVRTVESALAWLPCPLVTFPVFRAGRAFRRE